MTTIFLFRFIPLYGIENIKAITVGSEHLYRKEFTGQQLAEKIKEVKKVLKELGADSLPVGFADSWNMLIGGDANPAINESDIILANAFSYWQGQKMENATASFSDDIMRITHCEFIFVIGANEKQRPLPILKASRVTTHSTSG